MKDMVRVYLSDFRITRETIDEVFRSHGDVLPEAEIERLGHFLNWKDPVLVAGPERFGWDLVRGNPLFHAYQAAREDEPSICFTVRESEDSGRTTKGLDGLSCRKTPFHGIVGISPAEVVRKGVFDGARFQRPALGQWLVLKTYEMDGFEAVDSFLETHSHGKPVRTETGVFATMTAAEEAFKNQWPPLFWPGCPRGVSSSCRRTPIFMPPRCDCMFEPRRGPIFTISPPGIRGRRVGFMSGFPRDPCRSKT